MILSVYVPSSLRAGMAQLSAKGTETADKDPLAAQAMRCSPAAPAC